MTDSATSLFSPLTLPAPQGEGLTLRNRTILAPMCQYIVTKQNGVPTDWHMQHYGSFAAGGFGLLTVESTGVNAQGRITPCDLGLYTKEQREAHARIVRFIHEQGAAAAVQLNHAGGKASTFPWLRGQRHGTVPVEQGGWKTVGMTDRPVQANYDAPTALDEAGFHSIAESFAQAAKRADAAGYDAIQIHAAHGYLLHQSVSLVTNTRQDDYGTDELGRTRLVREVVDAIRSVWPATKPLGIRISATDWLSGGWDVEAAARMVHDLVVDHGVNWVDVSSAGLGDGTVPSGPGFHAILAVRITQALSDTDAVVSTVGGISAPEQAETMLRTHQADVVSIGRAALRNPHWPAAAAARLGVPDEDNPASPSLWRAQWR